jgi:hypothetical protein
MGFVADVRFEMPSKRHVSRVLLMVVCLTASLAIPGIGSAATASPGAGTGDRSASTACPSGGSFSGASADESGNLSLDTLVAPGADYDRLTDADALSAARRAGTLTPAIDGVDLTWEDDLVAYRDVVVHRVGLNGSATDLLDRLAAQERGSPTENFRALVAGDEVAFDYIGATACPPELALNASIDREAVRVVPDREHGALFLVLDTDRLLFHPLGGGEPTTDTFVKGHHGLTLTLRASSGLVAENTTVESHYDVADARVEFVGERDGLVRVAPDDDQTVRGRTTLAPGSEVEVTLHPYTGSGDNVTATATVNRSREFAAEFDLTNVSPETTYATAVTGVTEPPTVEAGATLVAVGNATAALVDVSDYDSDGPVSTLYPIPVTTTDGGFVVVRNASGDLLGVSEYLEPGATTARPEFSPALVADQTVTATAYRDANANREFDDADVPYRTNGSVVRDAAAVRIEGDWEPTTTAVTPTTTVGARTTTEPTTGSTSTDRPMAGETSAKTEDDGRTPEPGETTRSPVPGVPGFGVAATAVALLALVVIGVARR